MRRCVSGRRESKQKYKCLERRGKEDKPETERLKGLGLCTEGMREKPPRGGRGGKAPRTVCHLESIENGWAASRGHNHIHQRHCLLKPVLVLPLSASLRLSNNPQPRPICQHTKFTISEREDDRNVNSFGKSGRTKAVQPVPFPPELHPLPLCVQAH